MDWSFFLTILRQDSFEDGEATGAMSWAFTSALRKNPHQSYIQLLNSIRSELEKKYTQKPQMSSSHPLGKSLPLSIIGTNDTDVNLLFIM